MDGFGEVRAVDVGNEPERQTALAVMPERFIRHHRSEIGTADADIDNVADSFSRVAFPRAAADTLAEFSHSVEHGMNLGHNVLAVDLDGRSSGSTEGDVQHRPVFRDVDLVASKHGVDPLSQAGFLRQLNEELRAFRR